MWNRLIAAIEHELALLKLTFHKHGFQHDRMLPELFCLLLADALAKHLF